MALSPSGWRKSTYSSDFEDACVEARAAASTVHVRDSKDLSRHPLEFSGPAWQVFLSVCKQPTPRDV
ncbi:MULTISPECIES: DUF397 domain-containing protein [unclassified Streptomyces]|uniref:DUF397 domain-containing protein n=1 Tax=unclassified Streptomyces TaxID=2593676 RepID=UPI000DAD1B57|nr:MULTISPECIES: DUF397 domain-containing protein [unclassified Streptomyces]PZT71953.1 DUF397 domain-containing protein [Streptomyces sp. AC1-42T]PZT81722.1 DUF397 domain-containing protein [Streptomyces sp. AC1-42W]